MYRAAYSRRERGGGLYRAAFRQVEGGGGLTDPDLKDKKNNKLEKLSTQIVRNMLWKITFFTKEI